MRYPLTLHGIGTVARLEFWLRIRAGRWKWLLAGWLVLLTVVTAGTRAAFTSGLISGAAEELDQYRGGAMFGVLMLVVLALGMLIAPVLTGQSVNGDRDRGTLATLQVTLLSPAEIALGKWVASWGTALVLLAMTFPLTAWCFTEGGLSVPRVIGVYAIVTLLLGVICAVALGLSAVLTRTTTSSVLAYLTVFALGAGTAIAFGIATAVTSEEKSASSRSCEYLTDANGELVDENGDPIGSSGTPIEGTCQDFEYTTTIARPDRTWWLLAPNPFVILADSAPAPPTVTVTGPQGEEIEYEAGFDPLGELGRGLEDVRARPVRVDGEFGTVYEVPDGVSGAALWPVGLLVNVLLGAGGLAVAVRRLRVPTYRLAKGQRIA